MRRYLAILATVAVFAMIVFGTLIYAAIGSETHTLQGGEQKIEQLQTDTNDNLCNQQAYQGGTVCAGGDMP